MNTDEARALEIAQEFAQSERQAKGVGGQPLDFSRATVERRPAGAGRGEHWYVVIPETNPQRRPSGLELIVDVASGTCSAPTIE